MDTSELIRTRYGAFAATSGQQESCCAASSGDGGYAIEQGLYTDDELAGVPDSARALSRGCGNPTGFAELQTGEVVVDLGCGGGIDLVLAAAKVGPAGRVIGVDFAAQMIEQATKTVAEAGVTTAELVTEDISHTQLPAESADVVLSNCVISARW